MGVEAKQEQGIGQLLGTLSLEAGTLIRQEVQLASKELTAKGTRAARAAGLAAAGGAMLHAGILTLIAAAVLGLGLLVPPWLAALALGVAVSLSGYAVLQVGLTAFKGVDPIPRDALNIIHSTTTAGPGARMP